MVKLTNFDTLDALIDATVPKAIRRKDTMDLGPYTAGMTESQFIAKFKYSFTTTPNFCSKVVLTLDLLPACLKKALQCSAGVQAYECPIGQSDCGIHQSSNKDIWR